MICPHCGGDISPPADPENFDDINEAVLANGNWVKVTRTEWDFLQILRSRMGRCVSYEAIYDAIYGPVAALRCMAGLKVYKHKLEKKLKGSRFTIKPYTGRGYALVMREENLGGD